MVGCYFYKWGMRRLILSGRIKSVLSLKFLVGVMTFTIFPIFCIFLLALALCMLSGQTKKKALARAFIVASVVGATLLAFSFEWFFFIYDCNFLGILVAIPSLTYVINKMSPNNFGMRTWLRIFGFGVLSTVFTVMVFAAVMFWAILNNPESL